MADDNQSMMFLELVLDLCYRLRLADDLFCPAAKAVLSAIASNDFNPKWDAVNAVRKYSESLQIIHTDFERVLDGRRIVFPQDIADWVWEQPDAETKISLYLERMHASACGMEMLLNAELLKLEVKK